MSYVRSITSKPMSLTEAVIYIREQANGLAEVAPPEMQKTTQNCILFGSKLGISAFQSYVVSTPLFKTLSESQKASFFDLIKALSEKI